MKSILVIDDDKGILDAIAFMLEYEGYNVLASPNEQILNSLDHHLPKVILLDYLLSGKDGCEIARELKRKDRTKHIPIIMISAHPSAKERAFQAGIDDFLPKPFDYEELLEKLKKYTN